MMNDLNKQTMFCSTIIPTIGRDKLERTVTSVLEQKFDKALFEVIVVNDSGCPLPEANWQKSDKVKIINTNRRERCVARNVGAALSKGKYLHFLDDDDWLLPNALNNIWHLAQQQKEAAWLYGSSQLVSREGKPLIELHHEMNGNCFVQAIAGEWFPLQASFIKTEVFFEIGGFQPLILASQDIDLSRRIGLCGEFAGTTKLVACIEMGLQGSSTNYKRGPQYSRLSREDILSKSNVFQRLFDSANSGYWYGRIPRAYFTSTVWNLKERRFFAALERFFWGIVSFTKAGKHVFSKQFWKAIVSQYESTTFLKGFEAAQKPVSRRIV